MGGKRRRGEQKRGPAPGVAPQQNGQQQGERPARHAAAEPPHTLHEDDERIAILARAQGEQERQLGIKTRREAPANAETEQKRGYGDDNVDGNACSVGDEVDSPVGMWVEYKKISRGRK